MKITVNEMVAFNRFLEEHRQDKMSLATAFKFNKLISSMQDDMQFFQEKYSAIVKEYADFNEDGTAVVKTDCYEDYLRAMDELAAIEVEVADTKLNIEEVSSMPISIDELRPLMSFFTE